MAVTTSPDPRPSYAELFESFDPKRLEAELGGSLAAGLNVAQLCCDRHPADAPALLCVDDVGRQGIWTFGDLQRRSTQFAQYLDACGIGAGDRVAGLLPRGPELIVTILGSLRAGAVYQPLFTAFGPKAIEHRLTLGGARLIVTDPANRPKLDDVTGHPPVLCVDDPDPRAGDVDFWTALEGQTGVFTPVIRQADDPFLLLFTSGTTGLPKGVAVPVRALLSMVAYMRFGLDLRQDDVFWNIADPGWAYGLYYAVIGPLLLGHRTTLNAAPFSVEGTCELVRRLGVTNFCAAPTAYRAMAAHPELCREALQPSLRVASSAGEPLSPELARWFEGTVGAPLRDQYGQTELGMVVMNHHGLRHEPPVGSAGLPTPGFCAAIVDEAGQPLPPGERGVLAVDRSRSPLFWFGGYWQQPAGSAWQGEYFPTGDLATQHADGSFSFVGRADDVISTAGYRVGPYDVESCLAEHPAVLECAVIGVPDAERGERIKAFVVLKPDASGDGLAAELQAQVRARLGAHAYPREFAFVEALPKTPSGKIQRFVLRGGAPA